MCYEYKCLHCEKYGTVHTYNCNQKIYYITISSHLNLDFEIRECTRNLGDPIVFTTHFNLNKLCVF
jgi:hypothetical protein